MPEDRMIIPEVQMPPVLRTSVTIGVDKYGYDLYKAVKAFVAREGRENIRRTILGEDMVKLLERIEA